MLPFYILHQSVIIVIGYFIIDWNAAVMSQYLFLTATSFAAIMILYEVFVRRVSGLRFLFGMKPKKRRLAGAQPNTLGAQPT